MNLLKPLIMSMMIVCIVTLTGCSKEAPKTEEIPYVMVTQPSTTLHEQKSYAGDVQARQQTALAFRVGGQVTARYVDVGDRVRVGQVLAKLDVADAQLQLNAAKAQLENAQAAAKTASDELKRFQQLLPINAVSRSQYDTVKINMMRLRQHYNKLVLIMKFLPTRLVITNLFLIKTVLLQRVILKLDRWLQQGKRLINWQLMVNVKWSSAYRNKRLARLKLPSGMDNFVV